MWGLSTIDRAVLDVFSESIDPATPATLYAGTQSAGVFKTIDGGTTWRATGLLAQFQTLQSIVQSLSSPGGPLNRDRSTRCFETDACANKPERCVWAGGAGRSGEGNVGAGESAQLRNNVVIVAEERGQDRSYALP